MTTFFAPGTPERPGAFNWALIFALGVIWGSAFLWTRIALEGFGPWTVAAGRTGVAALAVCAMAALAGQSVHRLQREQVPWVVAIGLISMAAPFLLLSFGLQIVPSAFAGVAMGAVPLLILPLVAVFSPEEGIGPRRVGGVALGFVGLVWLIGPEAMAGAGDGTALGQVACVAAAGCYAIGSIVTRRAPPIPPLRFAAGSLIVASIVLAPIALALEGWPQDVASRPLWGLVVLGLFPTGLALTLRLLVIQSAGSLFMSLTSYMVPVWAVVFGMAFLGEELPPRVFGALAVILAGIGLAQSRALLAGFRRRG